jgi:uncharacterized protein (DUF433 family)
VIVPANVITMPPRGHYLASEAGQLAGVSGREIGQWAHYGYIRASQSEPGEYPRVYSFQDVAEAIIVHELIDQKVPLQALRPVIEALRDEYGDWPLQRVELETISDEGLPVAALLVKHAGRRFELGKHGWQRVQDLTVNPRRVVADLQRGGWAVRLVPDLQHIEVNPDRLSGRPVIRGRRVAAAEVAELAQSEEGKEALREDYEVTREETNDAVRWWNAIQRFDRAA